MQLFTVRHTGLRYVLACGAKAGIPISYTHFIVHPLPEDASNCVTIVRDKRLTLASWITRDKIARSDPRLRNPLVGRSIAQMISEEERAAKRIIAEISAEWRDQEELIKRGAKVANSPQEAALLLGIPENALVNRVVEETNSTLKRAILEGTTVHWPEEYKEFVRTF